MIRETLEDEISSIIGMSQLKEALNLFVSYACMLFVGNHGTGKTSIARIVAKILSLCDLVDKPNLITAQMV